MNRTWVHCPRCSHTGLLCDLCNGKAGWYEYSNQQDVESLIRQLPRDDNTLAITPERMTDELTKELVNDLDLGDFDLNDWEVEFIGGNVSRDFFSLKRKRVVYDIARKYKLL